MAALLRSALCTTLWHMPFQTNADWDTQGLCIMHCCHVLHGRCKNSHSEPLMLVQVSHLQEKGNFAILEQDLIIYSAGFLLTASAESILVDANHAAANNKMYCMNISAPFLLQVCLCCALSICSLATVSYGMLRYCKTETLTGQDSRALCNVLSQCMPSFAIQRQT